MAWMDPSWPDRDQEYAEKVHAEGRPQAPDTPANRSLNRVALIIGSSGLAVFLLAAVLLLIFLMR